MAWSIDFTAETRAGDQWVVCRDLVRFVEIREYEIAALFWQNGLIPMNPGLPPDAERSEFFREKLPQLTAEDIKYGLYWLPAALLMIPEWPHPRESGQWPDRTIAWATPPLWCCNRPS